MTNLAADAAKKAKINAIWEQLNAKDAVLSSKRTHVAASPSPVRPPSKAADAMPGWMKNLGMVPKKLSSEDIVLSSRPAHAAASPSPVGPPSTMAATPGWMKNLGMVPKKPANEVRLSPAENGAREPSVGTEGVEGDLGSDRTAEAEAIRKEEARKVASAALAAAKVAAKASIDGKVEINEVRDFAGEEVRVTKYVNPNSKVAVAARRKADEVSSSGLDALLEQIGKKQKLNILDKSRKDWGEFKEETGIETELESHIKSGDKYTDKVAFLQRSDLREYEKERDARLAVMSKRRSESALVD